MNMKSCYETIVVTMIDYVNPFGIAWITSYILVQKLSKQSHIQSVANEEENARSPNWRVLGIVIRNPSLLRLDRSPRQAG